MLKRIALILAFIFVSSAALALYQVEIQDLRNKKEYQEIRYKNSGEKLYDQTRKMSTARFDGNKYYIVEVVDKGVGKRKGETKKVVAHYILEGKKITAVQNRREILIDDKLVKSRQLDYDWENMKVHLTMKNHLKNETKNQTKKLNTNMLDSQDSGLYLEYLVRNKIKEFDFDMIAPGGTVYRMRAKASYEPQTIEIAGKNIDCYPVTMKPTGLLGLVAPTLTYMFDTQTSEFQRYMGPESSPTSPHVIQDLLEEKYF
jgi:hypothetical protein